MASRIHQLTHWGLLLSVLETLLIINSVSLTQTTDLIQVFNSCVIHGRLCLSNNWFISSRLSIADDKESACSAEELVSISGQEDSLGRVHPTPVFLENSMNSGNQAGLQSMGLQRVTDMQYF